MSALIHDLRAAVALLRRRPLFSLLTVATLALGIAANTTIFALVEATVLRRPAYPDPDRLVVVREVGTAGQEMQTSWPTFRDWERSGVFTAAGAYAGAVTTVLGGARPQRVQGEVVSPGFFAALGVRPQLGRFPGIAEARSPVVVVSDHFWRESLGGAPLGTRKLEAEGKSLDVVAVMPPGLDFPGGVHLWVPAQLFGEDPPYRSAHNYRVVARLAPGVSVAAAEERIAALTRQVANTGPDGADSKDYLPVGARVRTLQVDRALPVRQSLLLLLGAAAFVLLVACLNLASTFLARGLERERELAVRAALGASRGRLLYLLLAEAALLAVLGAAAGVGLALAAGKAVLAVAPPVLADVVLGLDPALAGYTLLAAVVSVLLAGLLPALVVTRAPAASMRGGRSEGISPAQRRTWSALMAMQAALALLLLAGAGLLLRSFVGLLAVAPGFDADRVATLAVSLPASHYPDAAAVAGFQERLLATVAGTPGVEAAGLASELPLSGMDQSGQMKAAPNTPADASYRVVSGGYFAALRIPLVAGRPFDGRDRAAGPHAAIVDRAAAELFWPGQDPLGKRISSEGMDEWGVTAPGAAPKQWATVVGVVGNVRQRDLAKAPRACVYFAMAQRPVGDAVLVARSRATAAGLLPVLRRALASVAGDVPGRAGTLAEVLAAARTQRRFALLLLGIFATLALGLAAIGVYGLVAYAVSRRTRELGVRLALGAAPAQAQALVLRGALVPVVAGVLVGLVAALPLARTLSALIYEVKLWDPASWLGATLLLVAVAALAGWLPARRAARLDPQLALRAE
ncbi:MAG TPA: ADOP family duplicated permease [Thermoanaerobaculia bacterium]|jgi:predicted permease|nr:ADOP family duplicated permease [Thermoanaerobaculia bacterium]